MKVEKGLAENTLISYRRDLSQYKIYVKEVKSYTHWEQITREDLTHFIYTLKEKNKSTSTISRMISSVRALHQFLIREQVTTHDPSLHIERPKKSRLLPDVLSLEDIDLLLQIEAKSPLEFR